MMHSMHRGRSRSGCVSGRLFLLTLLYSLSLLLGANGAPVPDGNDVPCAYTATTEMRSPIHFVWRMAGASEMGYDKNKTRVFTAGDSLTGCCDGTLALAITSALVHNPSADVWLWSDERWSDAIVHKSLVNHPRLQFHYFDAGVLAAKFSSVAETLLAPDNGTWPHRSVIWSDLSRYLILLAHGGSYLDADMVMKHSLGNVVTGLEPAELRPTLDRPLFALSPMHVEGPSKGLPGAGVLKGVAAEPGQRLSYSNNILIGLPPNYWVLRDALQHANDNGRIWGRFFNYYGPMFITYRAAEGMTNAGLQPAYAMPLAIYLGSRPLRSPATEGGVRSFLFGSPKLPVVHLELDDGDMLPGSIAHVMLCGLLPVLGLTAAGGQVCADDMDLYDAKTLTKLWAPRLIAQNAEPRGAGASPVATHGAAASAESAVQPACPSGTPLQTRPVLASFLAQGFATVVRTPALPPQFVHAIYHVPSLGLVYLALPLSGSGHILRVLRRSLGCPPVGSHDCSGIETLSTLDAIDAGGTVVFTFVKHPERRTQSAYSHFRSAEDRDRLHSAAGSASIPDDFAAFATTAGADMLHALPEPLGSALVACQAEYALTRCGTWAVDFIGSLEHFEVALDGLVAEVRRRAAARPQDDAAAIDASLGNLLSAAAMDKEARHSAKQDLSGSESARKERDAFASDPSLAARHAAGRCATDFEVFQYKASAYSKK